MDIEEQLRQYAQQLRNSGASREQAAAALAARRRELEASQPAQPEQPVARAPEAGDGGLTASQRARLAAQGALLSFGDEAEAAVRAAAALVPGGKSPREAYSETVERAREDIKKAYEEAPLQAFATEVGGGFIPAALAAPFTGGGSFAPLAARGATLAPRLAGALGKARSAAQWTARNPIRGGAAVGAISGFGAGEDLESRAATGALGTVFGGSLGALFRAGGAIARRGDEFVQSRALMREAEERAAGSRAAGIPMSIEEAFSDIVREKSPASAVRSATERVGEALLAQGIEPARAAQYGRPGQLVAELGVPTRELRALEMGIIPSSVGAGPVQRLARGISVAGGEASERLRSRIEKRLENVSSRVKGELTARVLGERSPYLSVVDDLTRTRKQNADELYEAAYAESIPAGALSQFINRPAGENWFIDTYQKAARLSQMEVNANIEGATRLPQLFEDVVLPDGDVVTKLIPGVEIPVRAADYIQRALKEEIDMGFNRGSLGKYEARILKIDLENFLERVGNIVPEFTEARRIYKDDYANLEALNAAYSGGDVMMGRTELVMKKFLDEKPEVVRRFLTSPDVSDSEKAAYISGALESILEKTESVGVGRDPTRVILGSEAMSQKVRLLLGSDEQFRSFLEVMLPERGLKTLESQVFRQSATAEKLQDVALGRAGEIATAAATAQFGLAARQLMGNLIDDAVGKFTRLARGKAERAIESRLLTMTPQELQKFYTEVYPTTLGGPTGWRRGVSFASDAVRRALSAQVPRMIGREF